LPCLSATLQIVPAVNRDNCTARHLPCFEDFHSKTGRISKPFIHTANMKDRS
jgi:hypothetical protein